jgi:hypothetical protein
MKMSLSLRLLGYFKLPFPHEARFLQVICTLPFSILLVVPQSFCEEVNSIKHKLWEIVNYLTMLSVLKLYSTG